MRKRIICTLAAAFIVSTTAAFGAVKEGSFSLTPMIGGYLYENDQDLDPALVFGIRGGYNFTKRIGIEALYDYVNRTQGTSGSLRDISAHRFGGQALYHFFPDNAFVPYVAAGYSGLKLRGDGVNTNNQGAFDYGIGAKYFMADDAALRGDIRHIMYGFNGGSYNNVEFMLGLYYQFGGAKPVAKAIIPEPVAAPAPAPKPVKVVAAPAPAPVPEPVKVIPAPAPVPVVVVPPPPVDSDGDGVIDPLDKCPGTPKGVAVDSNGCPVDSDKDGVPDYLDKCPDTPAGVAVDPNGCPVDTDKDGVADYLDKCPDTPTGVVVDAKGCPVETAKKFCDKPSVIAIAFDANKAEVKSQYHDELDKLGNFMKEFPNSKGSIEGHTDADGSKQANQKLSQARAESVRTYIINKFGIDGSRIVAKGHGASKPVASNKTASGKAKNRRIEAVFTCE
jgi:OOP family OmpA-OmpF porin